MNQHHSKLYPFLKAVHGNWHNAIFLKCCHTLCPYGQVPLCAGFLLTADAEGIPILMPTETFRELTGDDVSPEDCRSILGLQAFETAYSLYLEWHTVSSHDCPVRELCQDHKPGLPHETVQQDVIPP